MFLDCRENVTFVTLTLKCYIYKWHSDAILSYGWTSSLCFRCSWANFRPGCDVPLCEQWSFSWTMAFKHTMMKTMKTSSPKESISATFMFAEMISIFLCKVLEILYFYPCPGLFLTESVSLSFAVMQHTEVLDS